MKDILMMCNFRILYKKHIVGIINQLTILSPGLEVARNESEERNIINLIATTLSLSFNDFINNIKNFIYIKEIAQ